MDWKKMSWMLTLLLIAMQLKLVGPRHSHAFHFTPLISHSLSLSLSSPAFTWQFHAWLGAAVVKACASPRWWFDGKDQNPVLVIVVYTPTESTGTPKPAAWGVSLEHTNTELCFCPENHFEHSQLKRSFLSCLCMFEISWVFRWGVLDARVSQPVWQWDFVMAELVQRTVQRPQPTHRPVEPVTPCLYLTYVGAFFSTVQGNPYQLSAVCE